jgi:hypothetical protein
VYGVFCGRLVCGCFFVKRETCVICCIVFDVIGCMCLGWRKGVTMGVKDAICHWQECEDVTAQKQARGVLGGL